MLFDWGFSLLYFILCKKSADTPLPLAVWYNDDGSKKDKSKQATVNKDISVMTNVSGNKCKKLFPIWTIL